MPPRQSYSTSSRFRIGTLVDVSRSRGIWLRGVVDEVHTTEGVHVSYEDGDMEWVSWDELLLEGDSLLRCAGSDVAAAASIASVPVVLSRPPPLMNAGQDDAKGDRFILFGQPPHDIQSTQSMPPETTSQNLEQQVPPTSLGGDDADLPTWHSRSGTGRPSTRKKTKGEKVFGPCGVGGCLYTSNQVRHLRTHKQRIHDIDVVYFPCTQSGCTYQAKQKSDLKSHLAFIHDIGVEWYVCTRQGCSFMGKQAGTLRRHEANIHDAPRNAQREAHSTVPRTLSCAVDGCLHRARGKSDLRKHQLDVHNMATPPTFGRCPEPGCTFKSRRSAELRAHNIEIHQESDPPTIFECQVEGCDYKTKESGNMRRHSSNIHDIGTVWSVCNFQGCEYRTKQADDLRTHKANIHNLNVTFHHCLVPGCGYKAKRAGTLTRHATLAHEPGKKKGDKQNTGTSWSEEGEGDEEEEEEEGGEGGDKLKTLEKNP